MHTLIYTCMKITQLAVIKRTIRRMPGRGRVLYIYIYIYIHIYISIYIFMHTTTHIPESSNVIPRAVGDLDHFVAQRRGRGAPQGVGQMGGGHHHGLEHFLKQETEVIYIYAYTYLSIYLSIYIYMYVSICIYLYIFIYIYISSHPTVRRQHSTSSPKSRPFCRAA